MLQRSLEESSVGEVTGNGTGSHKMGKTMGRESCPAPGNPGEGEPSFPPTSPSVPSFPESSVFQHPVRSLNVLIPPPCVNYTNVIFLAIEMHFFYFNSIMILSIKIYRLLKLLFCVFLKFELVAETF